MRCSLLGILVVGTLLALTVSADDVRDKAIKRDRQRIQGNWRVTSLTINGNQTKTDDANKIVVINGDDGSWIVRSEGKVIGKGTSTFDPTKKPKTIDFTPTEGGGQGNRFLGIYQLRKDARKLCFAPADKDRPSAFSSTPENHQILVEFKRISNSDESVSNNAMSPIATLR